MTAPTRFDGVPVKDKALAALLTAAEQQGFRIEAATNGGHQKQTGLVVYPPDTAHAPIRLGVAVASPKHVLNVRADLRAAGFTDGTATTPTEETDMARKKHDHQPSNMQEAIDALPEDEKTQFIGHVAAAAVTRVGAPPSVGALVGVMVETIAEWVRDPDVKARMAEEFGGAQQAQVDEALALAAAAEERAVRAEAALEKADARLQQARADCGEALDRAKAAEARAEALDAALRPLRAILSVAE